MTLRERTARGGSAFRHTPAICLKFRQTHPRVWFSDTGDISTIFKIAAARYTGECKEELPKRSGKGEITMENRSVAPMRIAKTGYIVMSLVFCVVGILFIALPARSAVMIGRALGVAMAAFGVVKLVGYFSRDLFRLAFQYDLEFGILLIALGILVLTRTENVMDIICIAMGIAILADGLFKIQISIDSKRFGIRSWWLLLVLAVITGAVGVVLVFRPWEGVQVLTVLLGIALLAEGVLNLCVALCTVKIIKHQQPDVIETDYYEVREYQ